MHIDFPAHSSPIRQLVVSHDDQYLFSIAESAYVLIFRTNQQNVSQSSMDLNNDEVEKLSKPFNFVLITKSEFEEQQRKIKEIQSKIE